MRGHDYFVRLLVIIGLAIGGMLGTAFISALIMLASGITVPDLMVIAEAGMEGISAGLVRALLVTQHLCIFIFPSLAFGWLFYRKKMFHGFDMARLPAFVLIIAGIFFLLAAYPLVNLSYLFNESLPLPSWAGDFENEAAKTLEKILEMNSPLIFIINLFLISILPGIGEELLFRGIVQKNLAGWLKNPIAAIWLSALIFSAIHMQFEGFFPRMVLGAVLGYLYHWTKNLWVPIIAHAFNNGIQVILIYAMGMDITTFEQEGSDRLEWWMIAGSVIVMYLFYQLIIKNKQPVEQA